MEITSIIKADKISLIGNNQGRNSEVYLAHDPQLGGYIALKEIPLTKFNSPTDYFSEARTLYANKHPRVVPIMYACQDCDFVRLTMPFYKNGSVQNIIEHNPLTVNQIITWGQQFLDGLNFVHINGFVHFDIKPTNILISDDGSVMLADFGQTRFIDFLGTALIPPLYPAHVAPEIFGNTRTTKLTDIYQCGVTLYRLCNGDRVYKQQFFKYVDSLGNLVPEYAEAIKMGKFPNRNYFLPHIPKKLKKIIKKALNIDPSKRHQTVLELMNDLGRVSNLLEWKYIYQDNIIKWIKNTVEYTYEIMLSYRKENKLWFVYGRTIRKIDNTSRNRNSWTSKGGFRTLKQAEKFVSDIFEEEV